MRALRDLSIKKKLVAINTLTASIALVLATGAFAFYDLATFRESATADLMTLAHMIGGNSAAALTFADSQAAAETLNTLRPKSHILSAALYGRDGSALARYSLDSHLDRIPLHAPPDGAHLGPSDLNVSAPVLIHDERMGTVYLQSDLTEINAHLERYAGISLAVLLPAIILVITVSSIMQRLISRPILELAATTGEVSKSETFTIRARKHANDEIGSLVDGFNEMLGQIQTYSEALQGAKSELEERVKQRTSQLQDEILVRKSVEHHLIVARDAAEASNKAKSEFLANMSHELRTPLNAVIGYSEMLEEDAQCAGRLEMIPDLRRIAGSGKHLLQLITEILDFSKIEAGKLEVVSESIAVQSILTEVAATAEPLARKNGNCLVVKPAAPGAGVRADPLRLRQCLFNLLSNACKFTEQGTIALEVEQRSIDGADWIDWVVRDTGVGIPQQQIGKLFQAFSQVDSSFTRRHGGTGLGLVISQRLCELMGGRILVESDPGAGSTFTLRLPAECAPVDKLGTPEEQLTGWL